METRSALITYGLTRSRPISRVLVRLVNLDDIIESTSTFQITIFFSIYLNIACYIKKASFRIMHSAITFIHQFFLI